LYLKANTCLTRRGEQKAADAEYPLDDQGEAKKYKGKRVKVTGNADENHMIRVKKIELSPRM
jgi:Protein of unknown function (DUF5818)